MVFRHPAHHIPNYTAIATDEFRLKANCEIFYEVDFVESRIQTVNFHFQHVFMSTERNLNPKAACIKKREEDKAGSSSSMQGSSSGVASSGAGHSQVSWGTDFILTTISRILIMQYFNPSFILIFHIRHLPGQLPERKAGSL